MVDVLLNTDDVVVIGPPQSIDLLIDIGPQGVRGSKFIVGSGEPNTLTASGVLFGNTLILNDMYINISPGENYGYMYQYISQAGANTWVQVLKVSPAIYSAVETVVFSSGAGSITIPVSNIVTVSGSPLTASNFNVQFQIEGANPIASSMEIPALVGDGANLVINFDAVQYSGSSWSNLTGSKKVHIFISIV
jgi:hypothetical protein